MKKEIFGLPGSGKSYIISKYTGSDDTSIIVSANMWGVLIKTIKKMCIFAPSCLVLNGKLRRCIKNNTSKPKYIFKSEKYFIDKIVLLAFAYKYYAGDDMFMDEGIIHRIVSFAVNFSLSQDVVCDMLLLVQPYLKDIKLVYLDVDAKTCFKSIKERNRHECEMDEFEDATLMEFLEEYKKCFDYVSNVCECTRITRDNYKGLEE